MKCITIKQLAIAFLSGSYNNVEWDKGRRIILQEIPFFKITVEVAVNKRFCMLSQISCLLASTGFEPVNLAVAEMV